MAHIEYNRLKSYARDIKRSHYRNKCKIGSLFYLGILHLPFQASASYYIAHRRFYVEFFNGVKLLGKFYGPAKKLAIFLFLAYISRRKGYGM